MIKNKITLLTISLIMFFILSFIFVKQCNSSDLTYISDLLIITKWDKDIIKIYSADNNLYHNLIIVMKEWQNAIGNILYFHLIDDPNNADIIIEYKKSNKFCGKTSLETSISDVNIDDINEIKINKIKKVNILINPNCKIEKTMKHEMGHALGIMAHIEDNGIMSSNGGNGEITPITTTILRTIYSNKNQDYNLVKIQGILKKYLKKK